MVYPTFINDGIWHFFTATYDASGDGMKLYIDGALVGNTQNVSPFNNNLYSRVTIGAEERTYNPTPYLNYFTHCHVFRLVWFG